jgi:predicted DNA-binding antitoxin AbrB/MazE fold protein
LTGELTTFLGESIMALETEAIYENGVLKLDRLLPLAENERVVVSVRSKGGRVRNAYGLLRWTGDPEVIEQVALDPEFGIEECP